jgi:hypothetical protein
MTTALVPLASDRCERPATPAGQRANADFVAHLIATEIQAPQTRSRRRAEPQEALAAYHELGQWPTESAAPGRALSRSL